jgi:hypothetical protein
MKHLSTALSETANTHLFAAVFALAISPAPAIAAPETTNVINLLCDDGTITIDLIAKTFEIDFLLDNVIRNMNFPFKLMIKDGEVGKEGAASSVTITPNTITAMTTIIDQGKTFPVYSYSIDRRSGIMTSNCNPFIPSLIPSLKEMCIPMPNRKMF